VHLAIEDRNPEGGDSLFVTSAQSLPGVDSVHIADASAANVVKHCQVLSILGRLSLAELLP
jgi:hypothetical protein